MNEWTDAMCDTLRSLRGQGYSSSEIAAVLRVSRNAVIGKAMRLGLSTKVSRRPTRTRAKEQTKQRTRRVFHVAKSGRGNAQRACMVNAVDLQPIREAITAEAIPAEQRKTLLQLAPGDCRWPYGDPGKDDFFFCAAPQIDGSSYCEHHAAAARGYRIVVSDEERERRRDQGRKIAARNNEKRRAGG